jgi:hypothetical protein
MDMYSYFLCAQLSCASCDLCVCIFMHECMGVYVNLRTSTYVVYVARISFYVP